MIRINLLPTGVVTTGTSIKNQFIVAGVALVLSLSGILFIPNFGMIPINSRISELKTEITKAEKELEKVQKYRKKLEKIKKISKQIKKKLDIIEDIEKKRAGPVWLMDEMTDAVSRFDITEAGTGRETRKYLKNRVFIQTFSVSGDKLAISGMAINNTYLVAFLNNLKAKDALFKNVKLFFSDQAHHRGALVRKFKISATVILNATPGQSRAEDKKTDDDKKEETGI